MTIFSKQVQKNADSMILPNYIQQIIGQDIRCCRLFYICFYAFFRIAAAAVAGLVWWRLYSCACQFGQKICIAVFRSWLSCCAMARGAFPLSAPV